MKRWLAVLVVVLACVGVVAAQAPPEPSTTVPALDRFHEVIMPMWHTAYPAKDAAALRKLSKAVESGVAAIAGAKLPGIFREQEAAWAKGLVELEAAGANYVKASAGTDDQALLKAAERLHTAYEALVRTIRPAVPEMNEFHKTLYVVQHTYVPERNWAAVCKTSADLQTKAKAVAAATLPKRLEAKTAAFKTESTQLVADAGSLVAACQAASLSGVEKATQTLHARYEGLTKIVE